MKTMKTIKVAHHTVPNICVSIAVYHYRRERERERESEIKMQKKKEKVEMVESFFILTLLYGMLLHFITVV